MFHENLQYTTLSAIIMITCFKFYVQTENDDVNGLYEWNIMIRFQFCKRSFVRSLVIKNKEIKIITFFFS